MKPINLCFTNRDQQILVRLDQVAFALAYRHACEIYYVNGLVIDLPMSLADFILSAQRNIPHKCKQFCAIGKSLFLNKSHIFSINVKEETLSFAHNPSAAANFRICQRQMKRIIEQNWKKDGKEARRRILVSCEDNGCLKITPPKGYLRKLKDAIEARYAGIYSEGRLSETES